MRLLWVKAGKLLPVDTGGKIRSYNLLKHLTERNETTLLSYYDGPTDASYEANIAKELPGAETINTGRSESKFGQSINYIRNLTSKAPFAVTKFTSGEVRGLLSQWDREKRFDVIVCDFLSASLCFPSSLSTPTVLFQHNVESSLWQRQSRHERNPLKRFIFKIEAAKMTRYEGLAVGKFNHVIAVSDHDRRLMSEMTAVSRISVVPTGVDLQKYATISSDGNGVDEPQLLFLGSMDWEANIDGVDYFCNDVWPSIKAEVPSAKFYIVGRNPNSQVTKWASPSVVITGRVESVLPYLKNAAVFIVPLRIGGGTRLKIYEAMAAGKAVVSTTVGAEGLDVHHGEDIILADTPGDFAKSVIELLRDPAKRRNIGENAAALAAKYDWAAIATQFENILKSVAGAS